MNISFWASVASIVVAFFAVIILYLTRKNILDILEKDIILFDKNFELKKLAIEKSLKIIDEILTNDKVNTNDSDFAENAKQCYNELLCIVTDVKIADKFYSMAIEFSTPVTTANVAEYKLMCRRDIGLKTNHSKLLKKQANGENETTNEQSSFDTTNYARPNYEQQNYQKQSNYEFKPSYEQPQTNQNTQPTISQTNQFGRDTADDLTRPQPVKFDSTTRPTITTTNPIAKPSQTETIAPKPATATTQPTPKPATATTQPTPKPATATTQPAPTPARRGRPPKKVL